MDVKVAHVATVDVFIRFFLLSQIRSLQLIGYDVVSISSPGPHVSAIEAAGISHYSVTMTRRAFTPLRDLQALWNLYKLFRRERFTIVHTHSPKAGLLGRLAARLAGVPIIIHTHHGFVLTNKSSRLWYYFLTTTEKVASWCCDLILSVNHADVLTFVNAGICRREKIEALGSGGIGIDVDRFNPDNYSHEDIERGRLEVGIAKGSRVIGFVGRLVKDKGLIELFQAARIVREAVPDITFLIVGPVDSEKPDAITPNTAREYGVATTCIFAGIRHDLPELYSLMEMVVLPSYREGFPLVLAEAAAMRIPTIATDIPGCREAIMDGRTGILVPVGDSVALAGALIELLGNPAKARWMGQEGRSLALKRFDERLVFEKVEAAYARLAREKGISSA